MKLTIPIHKRIEQLFCKHESVGWFSASQGINSAEGKEYVTYSCSKCGVSVSEWFSKNEWRKLDFPDEHEYGGNDK